MRSNRRFSRFLPDQPEVWITTAQGTKVVGELVNESYGGVGILVDDPAGLVHGDEVNVQFDEMPEEPIEGDQQDWVRPVYPAVIVAHRKQEDSTFLGLKWLAEGDEEDSGEDQEPLPWESEPESYTYQGDTDEPEESEKS